MVEKNSPVKNKCQKSKNSIPVVNCGKGKSGNGMASLKAKKSKLGIVKTKITTLPLSEVFVF